MDTDALIQNISFSQKLFLLLFLLAISFYYLRANNFKLRKVKENDNELLAPLIESLKYYGSYIYLIFLPLFILLLDKNVEFYIFLSVMIGIYSLFLIIASATFMYKNGKKLWESIEGWF